MLEMFKNKYYQESRLSIAYDKFIASNYHTLPRAVIFICVAMIMNDIGLNVAYNYLHYGMIKNAIPFSSTACLVSAIVLSFIYYYHQSIFWTKSIFPFNKIGLKSIGYVILAALIIQAALIIKGRFGFHSFDEVNEFISSRSLSLPFYTISLIYTCLIAPISEEIVFRGVLFKIFQDYLGNILLTVIFSALVFGAYHEARGLSAQFNAVIFGLGMAYMRYKSKSLWPSIVFHIFENSMATFVWLHI